MEINGMSKGKCLLDRLLMQINTGKLIVSLRPVFMCIKKLNQTSSVK